MARQQVRITPYYMVESFWETDIPTQYINYYDTAEELFRAIAKFYAFSDCNSYGEEFTIVEVMCEGKRCSYVGWMPGMEYRFVNEDGEVVFDEFFPEWDH